MRLSPAKQVVLRHNVSYLMAAGVCILASVFAMSIVLSTDVADAVEYSLLAIGAAALFVGGVNSALYRLRWSLWYKGDEFYYVPAIGPARTIPLEDIDAFEVKEDRFSLMPDSFRREFGAAERKTRVDAVVGDKRLFAFSNTDAGFYYLCECLGVLLPEYEQDTVIAFRTQARAGRRK
jgi:hypothetical protein